jgi:hypothetical protein
MKWVERSVQLCLSLGNDGNRLVSMKVKQINIMYALLSLLNSSLRSVIKLNKLSPILQPVYYSSATTK